MHHLDDLAVCELRIDVGASLGIGGYGHPQIAPVAFRIGRKLAGDLLCLLARLENDPGDLTL